MMRGSRAVVGSTPSDSHTWNLIFLQLLLEEYGIVVRNLGACLPVGTLVDECRQFRPNLVVLSSVNGHGHAEGQEIIRRLRETPVLERSLIVIGGMLTTDPARDAQAVDDLMAQGFDAVYTEPDAVARFRLLVAAVQPAVVADAS